MAELDWGALRSQASRPAPQTDPLGRPADRGAMDWGSLKSENRQAPQVLPEVIIEETVPEDKPVLERPQMRKQVLGKEGQDALRNEAYTQAFAEDGVKVDPMGAPAEGDATFGFKIGRALEQGGIKAARHVFAQQYPDGDLVEKDIPKYGKILFYNTAPGDDYKPFGNKFGTALGENLNVRNAAALGAAVATGGASVPVSAGATALGAFGGSLVDSGIQVANNQEPPDTTAVEHVTRALRSGAIEGAGSLVAGAAGTIPSLKVPVKDAVLNHLFRRPSPAITSLIDEVRKEGLVPLGVGQVSDNPAVRMLTRQASTTNQILADMSETQLASLRTKIEGYVAQGNDISLADLGILHDIYKEELFKKFPQFTLTGRSDAGRSLQEGLRKFETDSAEINRAQYSKVNYVAKEGDLTFDASPMIQTAAELEQGVLAPAVRRDRNWVAVSADGAEETTRVGGPTKIIQTYIDKIRNLAPKLKNVRGPDIETDVGLSEGKLHSALDQLQAIRQGLFDLMHEAPDAATRRQAHTLWASTVDVMEKPNGAPAIVAGVKQANAFNRDREATLSPLRSLIDRENPGNMAANLIAPGKLDQLRRVKEVLQKSSPDAWDAVVNGYKTDLLADPAKISQKLDILNKDPDVRRLVLSGDEERLFREVGNQYKRWENSTTAQLIEGRQKAVSNQIKLALEGSPDELQALVDAAKKGSGADKLRTDLRAGVFQHILDQSVRDVPNRGRMIDTNALVETISKLEGSEMKERLKAIMRPEDWRRIRTFAEYAASIGSREGAGATGLAAAETVATLSRPVNIVDQPTKYALNMMKLFNNAWWARLLATPASANLTQKAIMNGPNKVGLRSLIGASMGAYADTATKGDE